MKLVIALASDINLSTPNNKANPSTGIKFVAVSVEDNTIKPLPVTPAAPLEVTISMAIMVNICSMLKSILNTCAKKIIAIDK